MSVPLPLLVTGIAGVAGYNAFHYLRSQYGEQVIGVRQKSMWPLSGDGIEGCDLHDPTDVARLWKKHQFQGLLNCAGSCRLKSCELDPEMADRLNVQSATNLIRCAGETGARVIHLSIDLVFAGRDSGGYSEDEIPDPVTVYGNTMVQAEKVVRTGVPESCILRISLPMGVSFNGHAGAVDWIASRFKQGKPATLYYDEVRTPTYTDCLNQLLEHILKNPIEGTFHAGGPLRLSLYEIAQIVNVVGGYPPELLQGCMRAEAGPMPPRAGNVSLDTSKLISAVGFEPFDPWPLESSFLPTHHDWHRKAERNVSAQGQSAIREFLYRNSKKPTVVPPSREEIWETDQR